LSELSEKEFTELTLLVLEMLKRGAGTVDVHPMHVCIRVVDGAWSVGGIPQHRLAEHYDSLLPPEFKVDEPPIDGEGDQSDPTEAPRVGAAQ
jgi:hypothetical protein